MCQAFLPIMRAEGRIVNVSSASGQLQQFGQALQSRFRNPEITLEALEALAQEYEVSLQVHGTLVKLFTLLLSIFATLLFTWVCLNSKR